MSYKGSRLDGGFHVTITETASATSASPLVLVSGSFVSGLGEFRSKALTITFMKWNKGNATSILLRNTLDKSPILTKTTSSFFVDDPKIGSKNLNGIEAVIEGSGSSLTMIAIPEKDAQNHIEL